MSNEEVVSRNSSIDRRVKVYAPMQRIASFEFPSILMPTARTAVSNFVEYSTEIPFAGWVERWTYNDENDTFQVEISTPDD